MADDAMDWKPITPPPLHNPYSHPRYMPGGWPESPPSFRYTTGVFPRKRKATIIARAAKRVCTGAGTVGTIATLPFKPIYLIVRHFRNRQRQSSRSQSQSLTTVAARDTRLPSAVRAQLTAAEQMLAEQLAKPPQNSQSEPQQVPTPPSTPPLSHGAFNSFFSVVPSYPITGHITVAHAANTEVTVQSPESSVTNTETTIETPASTRKRLETSTVVQSVVDAERRGEEEEEFFDQGSVNSTIIKEQKLRSRNPERDTSSQAERMKGANPFVAGYKRSPTAYGSRGLTAGRRLRAIGSKTKTTRKGLDFWGGYEYEQPIGAVNTSDHSRSALHASGAEHSHASVSPPIPPEVEELNPRATPNKESVGKEGELHDERWSSVCVVAAYPYEDCEETEETTPEQRASGAEQDSSEQKLFYGKGTIDPPSRVKTRPVISSNTSHLVSKEDVEEDTKTHITAVESQSTEGGTTMKEGSPIIESTEQVNEHLTPQENDADHPTTDSDTTNLIKEHVDTSIIASSNALLGNKSAVVPTTPLKVLAKKSAKPELETPATNVNKSDFVTPAKELSMLKIEDRGDNDTPKATPHSGTKTTRITRYREALEKAQKARLEQYEIVPMTDEWDKKVRKAVRQGIPDYLGPQDLARVVPQYASYGQDNWLNDETINKYLELVAEHGRKNDRPDQVRTHHTFNNFFYNNLKSKGPESVSRWSKRAKIGGTNLAYVEKIFVPINSGAHWTLAVVEPTQKKITHYNSMRGSGTGMRACQDLKAWVALEQGKAFKEEEWTLTAVGESPQQTNSDDCGVFTITSARQIMLGYTPMSYGSAQIPIQRIRIVAELINRGLLKSTDQA